MQADSSLCETLNTRGTGTPRDREREIADMTEPRIFFHLIEEVEGEEEEGGKEAGGKSRRRAESMMKSDAAAERGG